MQYDFYCGKIVPFYSIQTLTLQNTGPISPPILSPPTHFNFQWITPSACPVDPCEQSSNCTACTSDKCVWCVDSLSCHSKVNISHCDYVISNPASCSSKVHNA